MNELNPELKRLMKWASQASPTKSEDAPFGLVTRVLAVSKPAGPLTLLQEFQRAAWFLACLSVVLIICGGAVLAGQHHAAAPAASQLPSALSFLASNLTP